MADKPSEKPSTIPRLVRLERYSVLQPKRAGDARRIRWSSVGSHLATRLAGAGGRRGHKHGAGSEGDTEHGDQGYQLTRSRRRRRGVRQHVSVLQQSPRHRARLGGRRLYGIPDGRRLEPGTAGADPCPGVRTQRRRRLRLRRRRHRRGIRGRQDSRWRSGGRGGAHRRRGLPALPGSRRAHLRPYPGPRLSFGHSPKPRNGDLEGDAASPEAGRCAETGP